MLSRVGGWVRAETSIWYFSWQHEYGRVPLVEKDEIIKDSKQILKLWTPILSTWQKLIGENTVIECIDADIL